MRSMACLVLLSGVICVLGCGQNTPNSGVPPVMNTGKGAPPSYGPPGQGGKTEPPKGFKAPKAE
jgi:hypothetical protein